VGLNGEKAVIQKTLLSRTRRGAITIETALVYPLQVFLLFFIVVGGVGVFRYQQVAGLAREAARWASVHGSDYQRETGQPPCTKKDILDNAVLPLATGMDTGQLTLQVSFINQATGSVEDWDASSRHPKNLTSSFGYVNNRVRVNVLYRWSTLFFPGVLNLQSTCDIPMSF
jgi:Flp pilus assembly protein TadG